VSRFFQLPPAVPETLDDLDWAIARLRRIARRASTGSKHLERLIGVASPNPKVAAKWAKALQDIRRDEIFDEEREARLDRLPHAPHPRFQDK